MEIHASNYLILCHEDEDIEKTYIKLSESDSNEEDIMIRKNIDKNLAELVDKENYQGTGYNHKNWIVISTKDNCENFTLAQVCNMIQDTNTYGRCISNIVMHENFDTILIDIA